MRFLTCGKLDFFLSSQFVSTALFIYLFIRKIFGPHICGDAIDIQSLSMSGTSRQILTGSWRKDRTLQIWDYGSGKLIKDVPSDYNGSMVCEEL